MRTTIAAMIAAALAITPARAEPAQDFEKFRALTAQLSEDLVTCAAFFMITAQGIENRNRAEEGKTISGAKEQALRALMFADKMAKAIGQDPRVNNIRLPEITQALMDEIGHDYTNYTILRARHLKTCVDLMLDPEQTVAKRLGIYAKHGRGGG